MAIKKFINSATVDMTAFASWITANKEGTVFEDFQFSDETISSPHAGHQLNITDGANVIKVRTLNNVSPSSTGTIYVLCTIQDTINMLQDGYQTRTSSGQYVRLSDVYLCKYGMIMKMQFPECYNATWYTTSSCALMMTIDDNNRLTVIAPAPDPFAGSPNSSTHFTNASTMDVYGYRMKSIGQTGDPTVMSFKAASSQYGTILQNFAAFDNNGNGVYTPFAYYAVTTQYTPNDCKELGVVELNDKRYITNGRWFIQDAD